MGNFPFFIEAKNVFDIWSFDEDEPRIAAGEQRGEKTIFLKKYHTIKESVRDNYRVLARGANYAKFRQMRVSSNSSYGLTHALDAYSEKGAKYWYR
ncbi:MAG: Bax protein [Paracoccaceae bacterium]|jgi:Bax protein